MKWSFNWKYFSLFSLCSVFMHSSLSRPLLFLDLVHHVGFGKRSLVWERNFVGGKNQVWEKRGKQAERHFSEGSVSCRGDEVFLEKFSLLWRHFWGVSFSRWDEKKLDHLHPGSSVSFVCFGLVMRGGLSCFWMRFCEVMRCCWVWYQMVVFVSHLNQLRGSLV